MGSREITDPRSNGAFVRTPAAVWVAAAVSSAAIFRRAAVSSADPGGARLGPLFGLRSLRLVVRAAVRDPTLGQCAARQDCLLSRPQAKGPVLPPS